MRSLLLVLLLSSSFPSVAQDSYPVSCSDSSSSTEWTSSIPEVLLGEYTGEINHSVYGQAKVAFALTKSAFDQGPYASFSVISDDQKGDAKVSLYIKSVYYNSLTGQILARIEFDAKKDFGVIFNELLIDVNADASLTGIYQTNSFSSNGRLVEATWIAKKIP